MDENPAVKLKTHFEDFHPTQFDTYRNYSDELFMSALTPDLLDSGIHITSMLGGYHYAKVRDEYLCHLVIISHNHRSRSVRMDEYF